MQEEWRSIPDYEGYYEVSNLGNLRSVPRCVPRLRFGKMEDLNRVSHPVKQHINYKGYMSFTLTKLSKRKHFLTHRIVAQVFCPGYHPKLQVNHINAVRHDNRASNLEWCDGKGNVRHAVDVDANVWNKKAIVAIKNDVVVHYFKSICEAGDHGFYKTGVSAALHGRLKTSGGFKWRLVSDLNDLTTNPQGTLSDNYQSLSRLLHQSNQ